MLRASRPTAVSRRSTGIPAAVLTAATRMLRSSAERVGFLDWCDNYARPQMHSLFAPTEELLAELDVSHERVILAPELPPSTSTVC